MPKVEFHCMAEEIPRADMYPEHALHNWNDGFAHEYGRIAADIRDEGIDWALNKVSKRWKHTHEAMLGGSLSDAPFILGIQSARSQFIERHMQTPPQRRWS